MAVCRYCGAEIIFTRTEGGKNMPCEKQLSRCFVTSGGRETVILPDGRVVKAEFADRDSAESVLAMVPHWKGCTIQK